MLKFVWVRFFDGVKVKNVYLLFELCNYINNGRKKKVIMKMYSFVLYYIL